MALEGQVLSHGCPERESPSQWEVLRREGGATLLPLPLGLDATAASAPGDGCDQGGQLCEHKGQEGCVRERTEDQEKRAGRRGCRGLTLRHKTKLAGSAPGNTQGEG